MAEKGTSRDVSAKKAIEVIKGPASNAEVMEAFRISPSGFADLLRQLYEKKLIDEEDLKKRGVRFKLKKRKVDPKPEPAPPKPELKPPPPRPDDSEFVDTVTLTEMLTFKDPTKTSQEMEVQTAEIEPPEIDPEEARKAKKSKFKITGLFKRGG